MTATLIHAPVFEPPAPQPRAPGLDAVGMHKRFGSLVALDNVSLHVRPGTVHALLGGNGAGKSTLVKCIMGFYHADSGSVSLGGKPIRINHPRHAQLMGLGMVYQNFTLVNNMTVLENLVLARAHVPQIIRWSEEFAAAQAFMQQTPFKLNLREKISNLAAGQKQKLEILKQLYLNSKVLFLDEPTSCLTPGETDEVLGALRDMTRAGDLTIIMITHRYREVKRFADDCTVLRNGKLSGGGAVADLNQEKMAAWMIGADQTIRSAGRATAEAGAVKLELRDLQARDDGGVEALKKLSLSVRAGEILGIAGVSGNGQRELVEVIARQRPLTGGTVIVRGQPYRGTRREIQHHRLNCLPEEPLLNTCVPHLSVVKNLAMRKFDQKPNRFLGHFISHRRVRRYALDLIKRYNVKLPSPDSPMRNLSGGNVQRAVLARELADPSEVLITANPCLGLDFQATAEIRAQIMEARNSGAAVLLLSEDLDEILELSDRIAVIFEGRLIYETPAANADISLIGRAMAGHSPHEDAAHA